MSHMLSPTQILVWIERAWGGFLNRSADIRLGPRRCSDQHAKPRRGSVSEYEMDLIIYDS